MSSFSILRVFACSSLLHIFFLIFLPLFCIFLHTWEQTYVFHFINERGECGSCFCLYHNYSKHWKLWYSQYRCHLGSTVAVPRVFHSAPCWPPQYSSFFHMASSRKWTPPTWAHHMPTHQTWRRNAWSWEPQELPIWWETWHLLSQCTHHQQHT